MAFALADFAAPFVGRFTGRNRLWFEPGPPKDDQALDLHGDWTLEGRFLRLQYTSRTLDNDLRGELTLGFDPRAGRAEGAWIDTFHQSRALMHLLGPPPGADGILQLLGDYFAAEGHPRWGWRIDFVPAERAIRMYNIEPGAEPTLGVEFALQPA